MKKKLSFLLLLVMFGIFISFCIGANSMQTAQVFIAEAMVAMWILLLIAAFRLL